VALVVLLAAAAFVGARLLAQSAQAGAEGPTAAGGPVLAGGSGGPAMMSVEVEPAKELPQSPPDVMGGLSRREGNSLFINSGPTGVMVISSGDSGGAESSVQVGPEGAAGQDQSGTEVEVVVTHETLVYRDETAMNFDTSMANGGTYTQQQLVAPGSVDEIRDDGFVTVWGERRGDRVIASVVLYMR
jgi:hypothetical protein